MITPAPFALPFFIRLQSPRGHRPLPLCVPLPPYFPDIFQYRRSRTTAAFAEDWKPPREDKERRRKRAPSRSNVVAFLGIVARCRMTGVRSGHRSSPTGVPSGRRGPAQNDERGLALLPEAPRPGGATRTRTRATEKTTTTTTTKTTRTSERASEPGPL